MVSRIGACFIKLYIVYSTCSMNLSLKNIYDILYGTLQMIKMNPNNCSHLKQNKNHLYGRHVQNGLVLTGTSI